MDKKKAAYKPKVVVKVYDANRACGEVLYKIIKQFVESRKHE